MEPFYLLLAAYDAGYTRVLNGGGPDGPADLWQVLCERARGLHLLWLYLLGGYTSY